VSVNKPSPGADVTIEIGMKDSPCALRGWYYQLKPVLDLILKEEIDFDAYNALTSVCYGKPKAPCETCRDGRRLFKGCYVLRNGPCANTLISKVEGI
jgi:hypothetical protein